MNAAYTQVNVQSYDDLPDWQAVNLVQAFLSQVQISEPPVQPLNDWTALRVTADAAGVSAPLTYEHATWVTESDLHLLLGEEMSTYSVPSAMSAESRVRAVVDAAGDYVASVNSLLQLESLIDRRALVERIAKATVAA
jgi:hypothetical protein